MIERPYVKDGKDNGYLIMTGATYVWRPRGAGESVQRGRCSMWVPGWEIDHRTPVSMGGSDNIVNLQLLCRECHREKTGRERSIASVRLGDR